MTDAGRKTLVKFANATLIRISSRFHRSYHIPIRTSSFIFEGDGVKSPALNLNLVYRRYLASSSQDGDRDADNGTNSRSSKHQEHHRRSYEQKRSYYQRDKSTDRSQRNNNDADSQNGGEMNHYQRLNVEPEADVGQIKSAYYSLSKLYHPDVVGKEDADATENFRLITESYDVLSDAKLRTEYDQKLNSDLSLIHKAQGSMGSKHPNRDFNLIFRTRDADMIFRARQEAAFQREKALNPKKFKAGAFDSHRKDVSRERVEAIQQRLGSLGKSYSRHAKSTSMDGSDFYTMHLYDSVRRRAEGMSTQPDFTSRDSNGSPEQALYGILSIVGLIAASVLVILNLTHDIDIASDLDNALKDTLDKRERARIEREEKEG